MSRETTDILYIDLDYYTPENYYVYTAEAVVVADGYIQDDYFVYDYFETEGSVSSLTCELTEVVGTVQQGEATLNSSFTQTAAGVRIIDPTLGDGDEIVLSASFGTTATASVTRLFDSTLNSSFTQTSAGAVTRGFGSGLNASASITCSNFRVRPGDVALTGAFNATITCVATKTGDILLQSQFTQSTTGSTTRSTDATLDSSATLSSTAGKLAVTDATLNSNATLTADAADLQLSGATLAASASLTADGFVSNRRPRQYKLFNSPSFVTGKFNQALRVGDNGSVAQYLEWYDSNAWKTWRTMSFWIKPTSGFALNGVQCQIYAHNAGGLDDYFAVALQRSTAITDGYKIIINQRSSSTNYSYFSDAFAISTDFRHIRIVRHSGGFDVWIDGSLDTPGSDTTIDTLPDRTTAPILGQDFTLSQAATVAIDEFWLTTDTVTSAGTSSFTVPTTRTLLTQAEQNNTIVLQHMNNDADDDLDIVQRADATLSSSATLSTDVARTRIGSSSMSSNASLSADATKLHSSAASTMNATATLLTAVGEIEEFIIFAQNFATLSVEIGKLQDASATLNSTATLTADGQDFDFAEAQLDAQFAVTAQLDKRFRPQGYVEWSTANGIDIDPYNLFPLEGMLYFPERARDSAFAYSDDSVFGEYGKQIQNATNYTIETWFQYHSIDAQGVGGSILNIPQYLYVDLDATFGAGGITSTMTVYHNGTTNSWNMTAGSSYGFQAGPNHLAVVKEGTAFRVYVNGFRYLDTTTTPGSTSTETLLVLGRRDWPSTGGNNGPVRFDAIRMSLSADYSGSSIPEITSQFFQTSPEPNNVDDELVWFNGAFDNTTLGVFEFNNFDTNAPTLDEQSIGSNGIKNVSATLNSSFSAVGTISGPQRLPATTISSEASVSADGVVTVEGVATLNSAATLSVPQSEIIIIFGAVISSQATLTANVGRIQPASATLNSSVTLETVAGPIREFDSTLDAQFTQTTDGKRVRTVDSTMNSTATMAVTGQRIRFANSTQTAQADLTADPTGVFELAAQLDSQASVNADNVRVRFATVSIDGAFSATMTVNAILRPDVYLSTAVTASIDAVKTTVTGATLDSEAGFTVQTLKVVGFDSTQSAQFSITIDNQVIKAVGADLDAAFTQSTTTDDSKTTGFEAQLDSEFTQSVTVNRTRPGDATLDVGTAMVTGGDRFVGVDSTMNSSTTLSVSGGRIVDGEVTLNGFFATLTAGDVINIDPFRTLLVPQETRVVQVLSENRTVIVEQETRVNTLL